MIKHQCSLPLESIIRINLVGTVPKNCKFASSENNSISSTFSVKLTDTISKIFELIGAPNRQARIIFNGQVLCPNLTFAFYNIHNNDKIVIVSSSTSVSAPTSVSVSASPSFVPRVPNIPNIPLKDHKSQNQVMVAVPRPIPISHKRNLFYSTCSNLYKKYASNNNEEDKSADKSTIQPAADESARIADIRMTQIESNPKSYRNYCSKYNSFANDSSSKSSQALYESPEIEQLQELREEKETTEIADQSIN